MRVVEWLRNNGHEVTHLREQGLQCLPNGEIFTKGVAENRVILTFDLDFGEIAALSRSKKVGVAVFRLRNTRAPHVIHRLAAVLPDAIAALEQGAVVVIEESRYRTRYFPVGQVGGGS